MATENLDVADLVAALSAPGLVNEDVKQTVYNLDEGIPTPFTDLVGTSEPPEAKFSEWPEDDLEDPAPANAIVDGADAPGNDTKIGNRIGNRTQISDKKIRISHSSEAVSSVGGMGKRAYQTAKRMMDLRRSVETSAVGRTASQEDDGVSTPGMTAGFAAWIKTNVDFGTNGSAGGYSLANKRVDAPTPGETRPLTWAMVRAILLGVYTGGGFPSTLMAVPGVIAAINTFLFSDAGKPFRAEPTANVTGQGGGATQTAQGYISVVLSDFGISLSLVDNRLQLTYDSGDVAPVQTSDVFILDPRYASLAYLIGYTIDELAKTGHADNRLIHTEWMTKCHREDAHGLIADIDPTAPVTAS